MNITTKTNSIKANLKTFFSGLVPLFILAHFMHHIPGFLIQPLSPAIRDSFHLDYSQIAWLSSAYTFAYGISNLPAGWLGGRIAPRILITVGVVGVAVCGLIAGLSPNYLVMVFAMILMGILGGGYHPSASPLISDATPSEKRGQALGFHQIGGTAANIAVPLLAAALATFLTWRGFYVLMTVPTIIYGIYLYSLLKRRHLGDMPQKVQTDSFIIRINNRGYLRRMIAFVTMGIAVQVFVYSAMYFVPLLVVDKFLSAAWIAAAVLSLGHIAGLVAGPLGGHISDRVGKVPVMLVVSLASGPLVYLLSLGTHWWLLPFVLLAMGACMYVAMPVTESYVISNISTHNRSTIIGVYYFASRGGPAILLPIIGNLIDRFSFSVAFSTIGVALFVITLICSLMLWGTKD
jgi:MFS family permease